MTPATFVKRIRADFEAHRNPVDAGPMSKYMLFKFPFLGIRAPQCTALLKPLFAEAKPWVDERFLDAVSKALWKLPEREYHHAGAYLLHRFQPRLTPVSIALLRELIQKNSWWDTVDALASRCVGPLVLRYPRLRGEMDAWSMDEDFWIRRCAIIHQLGYKEKTDVERLFRYCVENAADKEFFIRKAIGWALRQYARTDAQAVVEFIGEHPEFSNLSKREALKHC
jgi:3-methyladenine DNA glycosylase AlkD